MIDLHTHTLLSDGELVPAEHIRRAEVAGYRILGLADHADLATMSGVIPVLVEAARHENKLGRMKVLAGVELTHLRPEQIAPAVRQARELGAWYVICHGETISEPVLPGTNRSAIEAGVDILAHPGLISPEDARLATKRGVLLEISGRKGHCLSNGHVARTAREAGAKVIFGSDAHGTNDLVPRPQAEKVLRGAGLSDEEIKAAFAAAEQLATKVMKA